MKIECTKFEWMILSALLSREFELSSMYEFPNFTCDVVDNYCRDTVLSIGGKFIDENLLHNRPRKSTIFPMVTNEIT